MSIIETVKTAADLAVKLHDGDLKAALQQSLLDAQGEALALQQQLFDMQVENRRLTDEIRKRDDTSELADKIFYAREAYWRKDEAILSAYCSLCWDTRNQLVRVTRGVRNSGVCQKCKARFDGVFTREERPTPPE